MAETYELWSMTSCNLVGTFANEAEALAAVRVAHEQHGAAYAAGLALGYEDRRGRTRAIADGAALVERALAAAPQITECSSSSPHSDRGATPPLRVS